MADILGVIVCGIFAIISLIISIMSFMEKGFLFNNAYIWASKQDREKMDKKPHYRQSAIVFALLTAIFFCIAIEYFLQTKWLWIVEGIFIIAVLVYAIVSSIKEATN